MYRFAIISLTILLFSSPVFSQELISLNEAVNRGIIEVKSATGTGGYQGQCLKLLLSNSSAKSANIVIEPGTMFGSQDEWVQDLIITSPQQVLVQAGKETETVLWTMCTQSHNSSPSSGSVFSMAGMAETNVRKLANRIARSNYQTSTAQSAMWAITSREPITSIYGIDTVETRELAETVSGITGVPLHSFHLTPRVHRIIRIDASLECLLDRPVRNGRLVLVTESGEVIREYFSDRHIEDGFQQFKVGASHTGDSSEVFFLQLVEDEHIIASTEITVGDTILQLPRLRQQAILGYELTEDASVEIGLYDNEGNLHMRITPPRHLQKGFHRSRTIADTPVMPDLEYQLCAVSNGQILAAQPVSISTDMQEPFSRRRLEGIWNMEIPEPLGSGRLALYDPEGNLFRIYATFHHLNAGSRRFSFQFDHVDGPDAVFSLRLETENGDVIAEKQIRE